MASIEYQGIKFSGGKFFIILSLLGAIIGGGWSAYKFYDDYLDMKAQIQNFVSPDLSGFDKKIALVEQELEMIKTEILDEIKILEDNLDLKINKALNNPLNNMSANVK